MLARTAIEVLLVLAGLLSVCLLSNGSAHAQSWPAHTLSLIVPFPPGGGPDLFARILAEKLPPRLGQAIVVDNRPGVGGLAGAAYVARAAFPVYSPRSYISSGYQGTLGWGLSTALGVKAACPDRAVVSVTGDGGFMFQVQELATSVQHNLPIVIVLVNDGAYGNVRRIQATSYGNRLIASDLQNPDFMKLADAFGVQGVRAKTADALRKALRKGFASNVTTLIEIPAGVMPDPWSLLRQGRARPRKG